MKFSSLALAVVFLPSISLFAADDKVVPSAPAPVTKGAPAPTTTPAPVVGNEEQSATDQATTEEQNAEDQAAVEDTDGTFVDRGHGDWDDHNRGDRGRHRRGNRWQAVCQASNARGMRFVARSWNVRWARQEALNQCYRVSRYCNIDGCRGGLFF